MAEYLVCIWKSNTLVLLCFGTSFLLSLLWYTLDFVHFIFKMHKVKLVQNFKALNIEDCSLIEREILVCNLFWPAGLVIVFHWSSWLNDGRISFYEALPDQLISHKQRGFLLIYSFLDGRIFFRKLPSLQICLSYCI